MGQERFRKIYIEIGNVCNLQCSFCPEVERGNARLSAKELWHILKEVKPHTDSVTFHLMGEPLAHPEFPALIAVAAETDIPVEITTNGTLLRPDRVEALLNPIVRQVNFSLQSYIDNHPDKPLASYLAPIFAFTRRALSEKPELYVNFRLWNLEPGAAEDIKNESLLTMVEREFGISLNRRINSRLRKSKRITGRLYLHYDTRFRWPTEKDPELRARGTCHGTRSQLAVHADGTVVPCCLDKEANIPLGNIKTQPFQEILRSERLQKIRKGFEQGELIESFCRKCSYATRFPVPRSR